MDVYVRLIEIYQKYGFRVTGGLFPWHFEQSYPIGATRLHRFQPFMGIVQKGRNLSIGGGVSPVEALVLSSTSRAMKPKRIFAIGNAFGWSTLILGLANPEAQIVAIDALVEGAETTQGFELTQKIIKEEGLDNISLVEAFSPNDVAEVCRTHFDGPIDFALIDGEHSNEQQMKDFHAVFQELADPGIIFLHDVLNWGMTSSFTELKQSNRDLIGKILMRTPSGMGVFYTKDIPKEAEAIINAFCEAKDVIQANRKEVAKRVQRTCTAMGFGIEVKDDWETKKTTINLLINKD